MHLEPRLKSLRWSKGYKALGVDEIRSECLRALDIVVLSGLTYLFNIMWRPGTVLLDWQTWVVVSLHKKGYRWVCSNYRGITFLSFPGMAFARLPES